MKGGHDLGGKSAMGPINPEAESAEPVFHADWERRVFALTLASGMLGKWNIDESRHARERQPAQQYLDNSYYENWLEGMETLLLEKGLLQAEELREGRSLSSDSMQTLRVPDADAVVKILSSGGPSDVPAKDAPAFAAGDRVKVRVMDGAGHTRAPEYVHNNVGVIKSYIGCHAFPDANSKRKEDDPILGDHLYSVSFEANALWPENASSRNTELRVDLWQAYLEAIK